MKAYLKLPSRKLLKHRFESEEDYIAGHVSRFLKGERFEGDLIPFENDESERINLVIEKNKETKDGKDLITAILLTKAVCNIINKYKK